MILCSTTKLTIGIHPHSAPITRCLIPSWTEVRYTLMMPLQKTDSSTRQLIRQLMKNGSMPFGKTKKPVVKCAAKAIAEAIKNPINKSTPEAQTFNRALL